MITQLELEEGLRQFNQENYSPERSNLASHVSALCAESDYVTSFITQVERRCGPLSPHVAFSAGIALGLTLREEKS